MDEITHGLDGIKIIEPPNEQVWMDANYMQAIPLHHAEVAGTPLSVYPSESATVEPRIVHLPFCPTNLDAGPFLASPDALIYTHGPTYTGHPLPIANTPYGRYPMGSVIHEHPAGQGSSVYDNGNFYPAQGAPYPQVIYSQYPVPSAGHYMVSAPVMPQTGTMVPAMPNSGIIMSYGYPYVYNNIPYGMQAPIWIPKPIYPKAPIVLNDVAHTGNLKSAMKQLPYTGMPYYGSWPQVQWQHVNVFEPLKGPMLKKKPRVRPDLTSTTMHSLPDFAITFDDAKHFIIKSFSEENVCKSIEHGLWASTSNGNKKLDEAFQDAQRRAKGNAQGCPVFLYFSVNGSGQFCGVAEMVGPVDYNISKNFWERSRWRGSFPVKWRLIKDVPNSQLRGIILKNNENKPVTSSRDTQEVYFEEGMRMLKIMKSYPTKSSVLENHPSFREVVGEQKSEPMSPLKSSENPKTVPEQSN